MPTSPTSPVSTLDPRRTSLVIWAAQFAGCLVFLAVAALVRTGGRMAGSTPPDFLDWLGLALPIVLVAMSFAVPGLVRASAGTTGESAARIRLIVGWALREAAALFGTVVWLLSGDARPLAGLAVGVAVLAASIPTEDRWRAAVEAAGGTAERSRLVR